MRGTQEEGEREKKGRSSNHKKKTLLLVQRWADAGIDKNYEGKFINLTKKF